jgi:peroxiredoxin
VDNQDKNRELAEKLKLPFPVLSDSDHKAIDAYGLYNVEGKIAKPALFVIDKSGVVRWVFLNEDYKIRALNDAVLDELKKLR